MLKEHEMYNALAEKVHPPMVLPGATAENLMTANPLSLREEATVAEAIRFLSDHGISAAPVIGKRGRPVGVVSQTDIVIHERARSEPSCATAEFFQALDRTADLPANQVVEYMVGLNVHRLFVVNRDGVLVGVISALDVLRRLRQHG
jgi:predicted transcriptional regulator